MSVFGASARYYDLLYKDKDYTAENRYISSLIRRFSTDATHLIDLGCGTGHHAGLFSAAGFTVTGMDRSAEMIAQAKQLYPELDFCRGDMSNTRLDKKFDVASALFHVVSYLTSDDALRSAFCNVRNHLRKNGLFVFDCWHGPAVVHQQPEPRIKRRQSYSTRIVRIAEPELLPDEKTVNVNYQIFVNDDSGWDEISETHSMRYFFRPEIEKLLASSGFQLLHTEEWLTGNEPSRNSWSAVYLAAVK